MANILANLLGNGAGSLVEAVGNAIDKTTTSDEERKALDNELAKATMQHEAEMASMSLQERKALLDDNDSARRHQSEVQTSEHASLLAKNVQPMLAVAIISLTFFMYWYIMFSDASADRLDNDSAMKDIVIYILGALTTVATQVVSYFFGSSAGSAEKTRSIDKLLGRS